MIDKEIEEEELVSEAIEEMISKIDSGELEMYSLQETRKILGIG